MTVGIGTLCQSGQCVLMAADMRGSFEDPTLPAHEYIGKQYTLPLNLIANTSGAKTVCQSIASELYTNIEKLKGDPIIVHDQIRNAIRETQVREFGYRVEHKMNTKLLTTVEDWKKMDKATLHYRRCQKLISKYWLNMQITVGGFVGGGPVLLTAHGNEPPEMEEVSVIGSGTDPALAVLVRRGQNPHTGLLRSVLHVYEAMEDAKNTDKYVGRCDGIIVVTAKQVRILQFSSTFMTELVGSFSGRDTMPLDDDKKRLKMLMAELHHPGITKQEYDAGKRRLAYPDKPIGQRYEFPEEFKI
jgi:hypothetical protein